MASHFTPKTVIVALALFAMSNSAEGRALDPATDFCTTVSMDLNLARAIGYSDDALNHMSAWLITPLQEALLSIDHVERETERFYYMPSVVPACSTVKAVKVNIHYSGRDPAAPIGVRLEIRMPGRPIFISRHAISVAQEIASGRVKPISINNTEQIVIGNSIENEAVAAAKWILRGKRGAI